MKLSNLNGCRVLFHSCHMRQAVCGWISDVIAQQRGKTARPSRIFYAAKEYTEISNKMRTETRIGVRRYSTVP